MTTIILMYLYGGLTIAEVIAAYEAATTSKAVSVSMDSKDYVTITFKEPEPEPEPEPEYRCNDDCWLYGRVDENDDAFPCSHCYKITRAQRGEP